MKAVLILICLICTSGFSLSAQDVSENYFHDLNVFTDPDGKAHLFYRYFERRDFTCTLDGYQFNTRRIRNDIYRFDPALQDDELWFTDFSHDECTNSGTRVVFDYHILSIDQKSAFETGIYSLMEFDGFLNILNQGSSGSLLSIWVTELFYVETIGDDIIVVGGRLYEESNFTLVSYDKGETWPVENFMEDIEYDSTIWDFTILSADPQQQESVFGIIEFGLVYSDDFGKNHQLIDDTYHWTLPASIYSTFSTLPASEIYHTIDPDITFAYALRLNCDEFENNTCHYFLKLTRNNDDFEIEPIRAFPEKFYVSVDTTANNEIYLAYGNQIEASFDQGISFEPFLSLEEEKVITGIHKKANEDVLYILTERTLFEYSDGHINSLRQIPVSIESQDEIIPHSAILHQNYPNPFNPLTTIPFELKNSGEIRLSVFDVTGKEVAVLADGYKHSGNHQVSFDASGLSSGIYFYKLKTGLGIYSKSLILVK